MDITPDYQVGIAGYSDDETRLSKAVVEPIYATCIAVTAGETTVLLYTVDSISCTHALAEKIRTAVTENLGISGENIFCSATHAHSCPSHTRGPAFERYTKDLVAACVKAASLSLEDRAPAKLLAAKKQFPGMNFVRHFMTANGTPAGSNFGSMKDNPAVGYLSKPDSQMVLVKLERETPKKSIVLVNWQGHPDRANEIGRFYLAPSYPGPLRDTLSALSGCQIAFFTGADGNTNIDSRVEAHKHNLNWREYGVKMAQLAYEATKEMKEIPCTGIAFQREMVEVEIDHSWDPMLPQANEVYDLWKTVGRPEADALGKTYGFTSCYQSRAIRSRAEMGKTDNLEINAFRIGGIGFVTGTYEMFSDVGMFIKEHSPFAYTFLLTGNFSYLPTEEAYRYRCYEADTAFFAPGTAEKLAQRHVELLKSIQ